MRFQTKLTIIYAIFAVAAAAVIGIGYYEYSVRHYEINEEKNMQVIADQLVVQVEDMLEPMELTMNYILSNEEILSGIRLLANAEKRDSPKRYVESAKTDIRKGITTDYISNNFYRVIVFNRTGDIISTFDAGDKLVKDVADFGEMPWLSEADATKGKPVIVAEHSDTWGVKSAPLVFSMIKAVQGSNMGYIEIQKKTSDFEYQLQVPKEEVAYAVFANGDELLFTSSEGNEELLLDIMGRDGDGVQIYETDKSHGQFLTAKGRSDAFDISVLAFEDTGVLKQENSYIRTMTLLIFFVFLTLSMIFVNVSARYLTKPLRKLQTVMENTRLENLGDKITIDSGNGEIEALTSAYQRVLEYLEKSMVKEKRMSILHIQAQFDLLQSQVNPHFLYNVLNVISARGMNSGDEIVCEMCTSLADMLRYSTNTKLRYTVIEDELAYLEKYFYLLKARFKHKIEFEIQVEEEVRKQFIPKLAIQQLVENSVSHGFENVTETMKIQIHGYCRENRWYVEISDNGQGFQEEKLAQLRKELAGSRKKLLDEHALVEMEIGGLGILNTYVRLLLLYNGEGDMELKNGDKGARVTISADINRGDERCLK